MFYTRKIILTSFIESIYVISTVNMNMFCVRWERPDTKFNELANISVSYTFPAGSLFSATCLPQPRLLSTANRGIFYPYLQIQVPGLTS